MSRDEKEICENCRFWDTEHYDREGNEVYLGLCRCHGPSTWRQTGHIDWCGEFTARDLSPSEGRFMGMMGEYQGPNTWRQTRDVSCDHPQQWREKRQDGSEACRNCLMELFGPERKVEETDGPGNFVSIGTAAAAVLTTLSQNRLGSSQTAEETEGTYAQSEDASAAQTHPKASQ